jgi:hypothetical protein
MGDHSTRRYLASQSTATSNQTMLPHNLLHPYKNISAREHCQHESAEYTWPWMSPHTVKCPWSGIVMSTSVGDDNSSSRVCRSIWNAYLTSKLFCLKLLNNNLTASSTRCIKFTKNNWSSNHLCREYAVSMCNQKFKLWKILPFVYTALVFEIIHHFLHKLQCDVITL